MAAPVRPELWFDGAYLRGRGSIAIPYNGIAPPPVTATYRPQRVTLTGTSSSQILSSLTAAGLDAPSDANYVIWPYANPDGAYLDTWFATLGTNDIGVLPEATKPDGTIWEYKIDSAPGFRRASNDARHFFSMARFTRGLVGLGPNAVINTTASSFSMPAQPKPVANGGAGVFDPVSGNELVGCNYKIMECATANAYVANFEFRGRDFGAVAYNGLTFSKGFWCLENVFFNACHRGFSNSPNGEAGGWTNKSGWVRKARNWEVECRDATGARVGSSAVLLNSQTGAVLEDFYVHHTKAGIGVTAWSCNSTTANPFTYTRGRSEFNGGGGGGLNGAGYNFEICSGTFKIIGPGTIINNYQGNYDSSQGTGNTELHLSGGSSTAKARIEVWNIAIDKGPAGRNTGAGTTASGNGPFYDGTFTLAAQTFGYSPQMGLDVFRYDVDGNPLPTRVY